MSLRDQLLKAGLVSEKQVRQAEQQQNRQTHNQKKRHLPPPTDKAAEARRAQAEKAARDQELDRVRREKAERKARRAGIFQMVEQNRIPRIESEDRYNFVDGAMIRQIAVTADIRAKIDARQLMVVRHGGFYALVPTEIGERIRERDAAMVVEQVPATVTPPPSGEDDPYRDFVVPDDLTW